MLAWTFFSWYLRLFSKCRFFYEHFLIVLFRINGIDRYSGCVRKTNNRANWRVKRRVVPLPTSRRESPTFDFTLWLQTADAPFIEALYKERQLPFCSEPPAPSLHILSDHPMIAPVWIYSTPWYTLHLPRENACAGATAAPSLYSPCSC